MTTRSLILHPHEIRAALAGTLGLVVRPVQPQPSMIQDMAEPDGYDMIPTWDGKTELHMSKCPLGVPGDRLRCRETWALLPRTGVVFREGYVIDLPKAPMRPMWRSPATMPAWASRITLEVVGVRSCRLHQLCEDDMRKAYGISMATPAGHEFYKQLRTSFEAVWDKHNAKRGLGWDTNPWAWAVEVRRVAP